MNASDLEYEMMIDRLSRYDLSSEIARLQAEKTDLDCITARLEVDRLFEEKRRAMMRQLFPWVD